MSTLKNLLGKLPYTAELYWYLRQRNEPTTVGMNLTNLASMLPDWVNEAHTNRHTNFEPKKVVVFGMMRYWIEHIALLGTALAGMGHKVTLLYLPFDGWKEEIHSFDLRRQNVYIREMLRPLEPLVTVKSLLDVSPTEDLPNDFRAQLIPRARYDTQYSLLREEIDPESDLYKLRAQRNHDAAQRAFTYLTKNRPDVVITPNGSILEFGVMFATASYLNIPISTYEFGEQDQRIWMAQNADVMKQDTSALWNTVKDIPFADEQFNAIQTLFASRKKPLLFDNFARQWQGTAPKGGTAIREQLGLDDRPLALIPANVLGDSLTLGRDIFAGLTEWLRETIRYFIEHPQFQLAIRVHPGEGIGWGISVYDILRETFPELPENIRLLPADAKVNTYDLVEAAEVGLVYTTTVGMEMAMTGKPVVVVGQTHYRGKGFTQDPTSWDEYWQIVGDALANPDTFAPPPEKVRLAWKYAYYFFYHYPQKFPWHLYHYEKHLPTESVAYILSDNGQEKYGHTFRYLLGEPIAWGKN